MTRITSTILVFMILMNGTVTVMAGSGLDDDMGVSFAPGVDNEMTNVVDEMKNGFNPNVSVIESLISLFLAAVSVFKVIVQGVYAAPAMFLNFGFPEWIVVPFFAPLYVISTLELVYMATGRLGV